MKKIIAIVGATGAQGGGLVRAILADSAGGFAARVLTRDTASTSANALADTGAEVVAADVGDAASLRRAFDGAYGAFCLTFFPPDFSPEVETANAKRMAEAAKGAGLKHVIWSTLEDTRKWVPLSDTRMPTLKGMYKVPHFDCKGEMDAVFQELVPTTCLRTSFFWENFIHFGMGPARGADGRLAIALPIADKRLPGIATEDIGRCAYGIFKAGDTHIGKTVGIAGEHLTGSQMAAGFSRVLGEEVRYDAVPIDVYRSLGFAGADDLANMFQFTNDFQSDFCGARDLTFSRSLNPGLQTFGTWLEQNKQQLSRNLSRGGD